MLRWFFDVSSCIVYGNDLNPFQANVLFQYPLKMSENQMFSGGVVMEYWLKSYIDTRALPLYFDICILLAVDTASRDIFIAWFENNIKYLWNIIFSDVLLVFR